MFPFYLDLTELAAAHWTGLGLLAAGFLQAVMLIVRGG
ncbi:hypothetical protein LzC2_41750 [Planctomycetes bacterium LzC2]|uniref:Uncharacterized protein n=1 Tax=Alienimonas chondri TaxID=2681879 RepID=A0ABX1VIW8_9PLAN|nr:hypothetical protein [Alienimonas chondri]